MHGTNFDSDPGEFTYGASLSALGPVMLPNERLLNELNVPKGKPPHATSYPVPGHCSLRVSVPVHRFVDS